MRGHPRKAERTVCAKGQGTPGDILEIATYRAAAGAQSGHGRGREISLGAGRGQACRAHMPYSESGP